jgi:hypothetical protein
MHTYLSQGAPCCPPEAARLLSRPYRAASRRCDGHCYRHMYNLKHRPDASYTASLPASYGAQHAAWWAMATQGVSAQVPASKPGRGLLARGMPCIQITRNQFPKLTTLLFRKLNKLCENCKISWIHFTRAQFCKTHTDAGREGKNSCLQYYGFPGSNPDKRERLSLLSFYFVVFNSPSTQVPC